MGNMNFTLIFDSGEKSFIEEKLLPLVQDIISGSILFDSDNLPEIAPGEQLLLYLSDNQIKTLLPVLSSTKSVLAVMPHPGATRFCTITGVDPKVEKAVEHLKENSGTVELDLLYCNDRPVISSVVIGSTFQLATSNFFKKISIWKRVRNFIGIFLKLSPFKVEITQKNGNVIKTAVAGIIVSTHKNNSLLSGFIPEESFFNDGMLHALLVCPRSVMELIRYAISSLWDNNKLPGFGAHIKTDKLLLKSPEGNLAFTEDGNTHSASEIEFEVKKKLIEVIPGSMLKIPEETPKSNEISKIQSLPGGEAANELSSGKLPFIRRASTEEFKDLFLIIRDNARLKSTYLVLMVLSTTLATLGLFANSSPVVIGAMILAPLMSPIISLSMASLRQDRRLVLNSSYTIIAGLGLSFAFAIFITLITPIHTPNSEILARTSPNLLDLGIAVISGIAGAYAHAREEVAKTLAGVAIAVALVPPLAVAGIGFGWMDWNIFSGAILLLFTNLAGMVLAASVTFMFLGFSPFRLATRAVFISFLIVILFSIPLALGFNRMIYEHKVVQTLDGWATEEAVIRDVHVQSIKPLRLSIRIVSSNPLDDKEIDNIKNQIEEMVGQTVELEITTSMHR